MLRRRSILAASAALPAVLALSACGGRTESQLQSDIVLISVGASAVSAALAAVPGLNIPAATMAKVQSEIALIKTQAAEIGGALAPGQVVVTDFVETVQTLASLLQPFFPQAQAVATLINAMASLAQTVLQESGALQVSTSRTWTMPPATARQVLRGAR